MEPLTATTLPPAADKPQPPLPRQVVWTALAVAAALPAILLTVLILVMIATQYNVLNWME